MPKLDPRWNRATGIQATRIRATGILDTGIRIRAMRIPIKAMRIRAMAVRVTWIRGHLPRARMAITPLTPTDAHPTATMDLAGSRAESLLASGPGGAGVGTTSSGDLALVGEATTEADGPFPGAEDIAVGSVTVITVGADAASVVADVPSMAVDAALVEADVPSVAVDVASVEADEPSAAVDVASGAVDMPSAEADVDTVEAEAEAVPMVVGAGRFRHISKLSRPTACAVGRFVKRPTQASRTILGP
ncbi:MAG: hypothetical protein ABSF73_01370 [Terriglobia bacterium]